MRSYSFPFVKPTQAHAFAIHPLAPPAVSGPLAFRGTAPPRLGPLLLLQPRARLRAREAKAAAADKGTLIGLLRGHWADGPLRENGPLKGPSAPLRGHRPLEGAMSAWRCHRPLEGSSAPWAPQGAIGPSRVPSAPSRGHWPLEAPPRRTARTLLAHVIAARARGQGGRGRGRQGRCEGAPCTRARART